jgi:hypothetical protein
VRGGGGLATGVNERVRGGRGARALVWGDVVQRERKGARGTTTLILKGAGGRERKGGGSNAGDVVWRRGRGPSRVRHVTQRREGPGAGSPRERRGWAAIQWCGRQGSGEERAVTGGVPQHSAGVAVTNLI